MNKLRTRWLFIGPYLKKYKFVIGLGLLFVVISTALDQISPWMIKTVIERFSCYASYGANPETVTATCEAMRSQIKNSSYTFFTMPLFIWSPLLVIIAASFLSGVLLFFQRWLVICASRKIEFELRNDLFVKLQSQPKSYMDKHNVGDLMSYATNDLDRIRDFLGPVVLHIARMPFTLIFTLIAVFILSPKLAIIGIIPVFVLPFFVSRFLKKMHLLYGKIQKNLGGLNSFIQDTISGIQVIKAYAKQKVFLSKFTEQSDSLKKTSIKVVLLTSAIWPFIGILSSLGIIAVIGYGANMTQNHEISLGVLIAVLLYLLKLQFPLAGLGWVANLWQRSNASMDRLIDLYAQFETTGHQGSDTAAQIKQQTFESLQLKNLSFCYSDKTEVLHNISLELKRGQSLGIVGPTGSGKTTLLHLICGIYEPTHVSTVASNDISEKGRLYLNQKPWQDFSAQAWKSFFSITPQDGFLFSKSIAENILLGIHESDVHAMGDEKLAVQRVGEYSGFSRDLSQIDKGYQALLGERGINLSGGQRQRVGLARAMLHNADVLCLDDTLSALDSETEAFVIQQMQEQFQLKTSIIIAHRYSAIQRCDHIIYLEEGHIVEQGTHRELLQLQGRYAGVFAKQKLSEELEKA